MRAEYSVISARDGPDMVPGRTARAELNHVAAWYRPDGVHICAFGPYQHVLGYVNYDVDIYIITTAASCDMY